MSTEIQKIIEGCINMDRQSQYKLYKMLAPKLIFIALRYLKVRDEAEDCLQEAFLKIFKNINEFKGEANINTWATRIVINTALTKLRLNQKHNDNFDIEAANFLPAKNTEESLEYEEGLNMLNELPDTYRVVFNMFEIEGYSHKEISESLNINISTCRYYLMKAKEVLRDMHVKKNAYYYEKGIS